jgi:NitT/TauT family transport system ATP-binding protein
MAKHTPLCSKIETGSIIALSSGRDKMIKEEHIAALLVTHDITEAVSMSDKVIVLSKRPAMIKNIYEINFNIDNKTPINVRKLPEFAKYFDLIWNDLNE